MTTQNENGNISSTSASGIASYSSNRFTSTFLPTASSFGSNLRAFQSNFPVSTAKPVVIDPSGCDVIVLQPGSRYMKIGFANQAFPHIVPHVLARPSLSPEFESTDERNDWNLDEDQIQERIAQRYRQSRRKPPPNIYQSLMNYNRQSDFEEISAHNDAFLMEWTEDPSKKKFHVGNAALNLNPSLNYKLLWPFQRGTFNCRDYSRLEQVVQDLGILWKCVIEQELSIKQEDFSKYSLVLVLPDSFDRAELKACVTAALESTNKEAQFKAVAVIQEGQAVTFGCGVSSGVVVDCGAQKISVACIEEGFLVPESRVKIPVGGDEITRLFAELLKLHEFPYEFDIKNPLDWQLLDDLKERCCSVNESEIAPSAAIFEFYLRRPSELTKKYLFKMFEERLMAPLELFEPEMPLLAEQVIIEDKNAGGLVVNAFDFEDSTIVLESAVSSGGVSDPSTSSVEANIKCTWGKCNESFDSLPIALEHFDSVHFSSYLGDSCKCCGSFKSSDRLSLQCHVISTHLVLPTSVATCIESPLNSKLMERFQDDPVVSIDEAILLSLLQLKDSERIKRCIGSIILSGGSHLFSGFADVLHDRLASKLPLNPLTSLIEAKVFPNARDLDSRFLAWKGGAVFCRLESTSESWISAEEWAIFGTRAIKEKVSFIN